MKRILLLVFAIFLLVKKTAGLRCYTCFAREDDYDRHCVNSPGSKEGDITDCDKDYCIFVRQEYKDPDGKLASLIRSCVNDTLYIDEVFEDATYRVHYRACRRDLCNSGN